MEFEAVPLVRSPKEKGGSGQRQVLEDSSEEAMLQKPWN